MSEDIKQPEQEAVTPAPEPTPEVEEEVVLPVDEAPVKEIQKSAEDIAFEEMNNAMDNIKDQREALAQMLIAAAKITKLDPKEDSPRITEVKLALFKTADDLLKSQESLHMNKAKMAMNRRSEATSDNVKQLAVEVLKSINMNAKANAPVTVKQNVDAVLQATFAEKIVNDPSMGDIKEDELEIPER